MKNNILRFTLATGLGLTACGSPDDVRNIDGRLDLQGLGKSRAEVVATELSGEAQTAPVAADGTFALNLDVGGVYAIAFREPGRTGAFAHLVVQSATRNVIRVTAGDPVHLGLVRAFGSSAKGLTGGESENESESETESEHESEHEGRETSVCRAPEAPAPAADPAQPGEGTTPVDGTTPDPTANGTTIGTEVSFLVAGEVDLGTETEVPESEITEGPLADSDGDLRSDCHEDDADDDGLCDDFDDAPHGEDESEDDDDDHSGSGDGSDDGSSGSDDGHSGSDDGNSGSDDGSDDGSSGSDDGHSGSDDGNSGSDDGNSGSDGESSARADLPYAVRLSVGDAFRLTDAFLAEGSAPMAILEVEMEGSSWRLEELRADTVFTVTEEDCAHQGNRDIGRDRIFVLWQNADGSTELDHLDLRYCQ